MEAWQEELNCFVNTKERLEQFITLSSAEEEGVDQCASVWGTTPYFASLMDPHNPLCPVRRQVIPSLCEKVSLQEKKSYLAVKENRTGGEQRPDTIARQYQDRG